jgi:hypothetical protein
MVHDLLSMLISLPDGLNTRTGQDSNDGIHAQVFRKSL